MVSGKMRSIDPNRVLCIIMGGGQGTRLFPLTRERAKPAVPLAGKYRLVDIPISNCINSGMRRIYLLTQFLSASLHRHVYASFKFDHFTTGFVEILAAEQTLTDTSWYEGTADAVRKNLGHLRNIEFDYALILSGDQLYRIDFRKILERHVASEADLTVSTIPVRRELAHGLGIMQIDAQQRIVRFVGKPKDPALLDTLVIPPSSTSELEVPSDGQYVLGSMGIYMFNRQVLFDLLDNDTTDFGKHIITASIQTHRVNAYVFHGYWEDIGTIRSFFEANLELAAELPRFDFFDMSAPIYSRPRFLPASKINGATIEHAIIADGCIINQCKVSQSIIGLRCRIEEGSHLTRTVALGADYFESLESIQRHLDKGHPRIGIGKNTRIENAIIDKNARIGDNCVITPAGKPSSYDDARFFVRDGVVIIPKNMIIPNNTVI